MPVSITITIPDDSVDEILTAMKTMAKDGENFWVRSEKIKSKHSYQIPPQKDGEGNKAFAKRFIVKTVLEKIRAFYWSQRLKVVTDQRNAIENPTDDLDSKMS